MHNQFNLNTYPIQFFNEYERDEIRYHMYVWSCGFTSTNEMNADLKQIFANEKWSTFTWSRSTKAIINDVRWQLFYNWNMFNLKMVTYRLLLNQISNEKQVVNAMILCGLHPDNAELYLELINDEYQFSRINKMLAKHSDAKVKKDFTLDAETILKECQHYFEANKVTARAYGLTNRRLRFIFQHNNFSPCDLADDLLTNAVAYYYRNRPFMDILHAVNYSKSAIDNRASQLIAYYTSPERTRITDEGSAGYVPVVVSDSDIDMTGIYSNTLNTFDTGAVKSNITIMSATQLSEYYSDIEDRIDMKRHLSKLVNQHKVSYG